MDLNQAKHELEALSDSHKEEFEAVSAHIFEIRSWPTMKKRPRRRSAIFWKTTVFQ